MELRNIKNTLSKVPIWNGDINIEPLEGGITNKNYLIKDKKKKYVARFGEDIIHHHIMRFHEIAANKAANEVGIAPEVIYHEKGLLILEYIESDTLTNTEVKKESILKKIISLIKIAHNKIPLYFTGPPIMFWVFHLVRDYAWTLKENNSFYVPILDKLIKDSVILEKAASPHYIVFCHNDLLPGNILNDGNKLWLIDWEYAGFNSPLFDLGGLASNSEFSNDQENFMLEEYFEKKISDQLIYQYQAMKCASLLRETMWSMVSEIMSSIVFDYKKYTTENLDRYNQEIEKFLHY